MRYLDLAVAALIGASTVTGIVAWTPHAGDGASDSAKLKSQLRDELLALLQQKGTVWLIRSPPGDICAYLGSISNSSVTFSASIGSNICGPPPPEGALEASLTVNLIPYQVVLEAWPDVQP